MVRAAEGTVLVYVCEDEILNSRAAHFNAEVYVVHSAGLEPALCCNESVLGVDTYRYAAPEFLRGALYELGILDRRRADYYPGNTRVEVHFHDVKAADTSADLYL